MMTIFELAFLRVKDGASWLHDNLTINAEYLVDLTLDSQTNCSTTMLILVAQAQTRIW